jgi:heat shock protein HtpX
MMKTLTNPRVVAPALGLAAVGVASAFFAPVWVLALAAAAVAVKTYSKIELEKYKPAPWLTAHENLDEIAPNLGAIGEDLYKKSGLSPEKFPITDTRINETSVEKFNEILNAEPMLRMNMARFFAETTKNEHTIQVTHPAISISERHLKLLDDAEKKAFLAHEFAQIKSTHGEPEPATLVSSVIAKASHLLNGLSLVAGFVSTGLTTFAASLAVSALSGFMLFSFDKSESKETKKKKDEELSLSELFNRKKITTQNRLAIETVFVAAMSSSNPVYLGIHMIARTLQTAAKVTHSTVLRALSLQADRDGVEQLGADPLAMITALRKIDAVNDNSIEQTYGAPLPHKGYLRAAWDKVSSPVPSTESRIAQMVTIARKNGATQADIDHAVSGTIAVGPEHNLPRETVVKMVIAAANTDLIYPLPRKS